MNSSQEHGVPTVAPSGERAPEYDPVTFEVINSALGSLADEMAFIVTRTAYSEIVREVMDFSTAVCDADGRVVAQGLTIPLHMFNIQHAVRSILGRYGAGVADGDVFITNDPYEGGTHLPDVHIVRPAFLGERLVGFAAVVAHQTDVGGRVAGSNAADSTEIYAEGLRIPPLRVFEGGRRNEAIWRILEKNVRVPDRVLGDVDSQISASGVATRGLGQLAAEYGPDELRRYTDSLLDYSEALTRAEIAAIPDGRYEFTDYIDDDGFGSGRLPIHVVIEVSGDALHADFEGTAGQVKGAINCVINFTNAAVCSAVRCLMEQDIPSNDGFMRPITVSAPVGSLLNPLPPASVAARALTAYRVADAVFGALANAVEARAMAAGEGGNTVVSIGGYHADKRPFILVDMVNGSWGGRNGLDGIEGVTNPTQNLNTTPVEVIESELPVRITRWGFVQDSEGRGEFRGGLALVREYEFLGAAGVLQVRSDRRAVPPYGLAGGREGSPSLNVLNPGTERERSLPATVTLDIQQGDVLRHVLASGGGYGDPLDRDPAAVVQDVKLGKVSAGRARNAYGVIVRDDLTIDEDATVELRDSKVSERRPGR